MKYEMVAGFETHVELSTKQKFSVAVQLNSAVTLYSLLSDLYRFTRYTS